jgi:aldose 1-epimerase
MSVHILENKQGFKLALNSMGLSIQKIDLPWGVSPVIGYLDPNDYADNPYYLGSIIGRVSNRIANATLKIGHERHQLNANEGKHHLHGGKKGFTRVEWDVVDEGDKLVGKYTSPYGAEGYPGEVDVKSAFSFIDNKLIIVDNAYSKTHTPLSLTHHPYFSFGGGFEDLEWNIFGNKFLELDHDLIPTGEIVKEQKLVLRKGIDTCCVYPFSDNGYRKNAEILHQKSNTKISIWSNYPAFQIYTSLNELDNVSVPFGSASICIEPQYMTGFTEYSNFNGFYFDGNNSYERRIVYEFDKINA